MKRFAIFINFLLILQAGLFANQVYITNNKPLTKHQKALELFNGATEERVTFYSRENATSDKKIARHGILLKRPNAKATILICHGLSTDKCNVSFLPMLFNEHNIMMFDFRTHGKDTKGQGYALELEAAYDVMAASEFLRNHPECKDKPLIIYGFSMGAASAIVAQASKSSVCDAMILNCPFDSRDKLLDKWLNPMKVNVFGYQVNIPGVSMPIKHTYSPYIQPLLPKHLKTFTRVDMDKTTINLQPSYTEEAIKSVGVPCFLIGCVNDQKAPDEAIFFDYQDAKEYKPCWKHTYFYQIDQFIQSIIEGFYKEKTREKVKKDLPYCVITAGKKHTNKVDSSGTKNTKFSTINTTLDTNLIIDRQSDAYVFFTRHGFDFARLNGTIKQIYPHFAKVIKKRGYTSKAGTSLILNGILNDRAVYLIFLGLGKQPEKHVGGYGAIEEYRRALGKLVRIAESHKFKSFTFDLPDPTVMNLSYEKLAEETSTFLHKASYHFDQFITNKDHKYQWTMNAIIGINKQFKDEAQKGLDRGMCYATAINQTRYWCDMPPSQLPPDTLSKQAEQKAKEYGLKVTVLNEHGIRSLGMGGIDGVSRGSEHKPRVVITEYVYDKNAPIIALIGKGVTYDTGGLSIKPTSSMLSMKHDMAGAAVVLSTMHVIAQLKPKVNVVAIAPLVENMPGASALKPGDIITTYSGKTIEVVNTDAEGRLILADMLAYAIDKYHPTALIDVATLTATTASALGVFYAGMFTQHDTFAKRVIKASQRSGDQLWRMPLDDDYAPAIKSDIADVKNVGSPKYMGQSITASLFLKEFVTPETPWVHLDIAGVAFGVPDLSYIRPGATGWGIRLLTNLVLNWEPLKQKTPA